MKKFKLVVLIIGLLFLAFGGYSQEYKTYQKLNDSTFVETRSFTQEEQTNLTKEQTITKIFQEIEKWARDENYYFRSELGALRVQNQLRVEQNQLIPDTSYLNYISYLDTIYSKPAFDGQYQSQLTIGDSTYNVQAFRNANGAQLLRIQELSTNVPARFLNPYKLRIGNTNSALPQINLICELKKLNENNQFVVFYDRIGIIPVRLKLKK